MCLQLFAAMAYRLSLNPTMSTNHRLISEFKEPGTAGSVRTFANCCSDQCTRTFATTTPSEPIPSFRLPCDDAMPSDYARWSRILANITGYTYIWAPQVRAGIPGKERQASCISRPSNLNHNLYLSGLAIVPRAPKGHMPYPRQFRLLDFL